MFKIILQFIRHPILYICELRFIWFGYRKVKIVVYHGEDNKPFVRTGSIKIKGATYEKIWETFLQDHLPLARSGNHTDWKQVIF